MGGGSAIPVSRNGIPSGMAGVDGDELVVVDELERGAGIRDCFHLALFLAVGLMT